jgi:hypothetical protein
MPALDMSGAAASVTLFSASAIALGSFVHIRRYDSNRIASGPFATASRFVLLMAAFLTSL